MPTITLVVLKYCLLFEFSQIMYICNFFPNFMDIFDIIMMIILKNSMFICYFYVLLIFFWTSITKIGFYLGAHIDFSKLHRNVLTSIHNILSISFE